MRKLKGYILITRPLNCLIGFLSIFIGGLLATDDLSAAGSIIIASHLQEASSLREEMSSMIILISL